MKKGIKMLVVVVLAATFVYGVDRLTGIVAVLEPLNKGVLALHYLANSMAWIGAGIFLASIQKEF